LKLSATTLSALAFPIPILVPSDCATDSFSQSENPYFALPVRWCGRSLELRDEPCSASRSASWGDGQIITNNMWHSNNRKTTGTEKRVVILTQLGLC